MSELCLTHVDHRYAGADRDAVTGVDLVVPDGSMTAVVGPSGSGKSTLLRVAAGLERPTAGRVRVAGVDVTEHPVEQRDLTVMFQRPHLFDHLDVAGNVAFAPRLAGLGRRAARRRARHWLDLVHLPDADRRRVGSLSGGQQQRVALARALAAERGLLLLDEPFSALDAELRGRMQDLLCEVRAEVSPTVLLVTHDLDEAGLADRVVVLVDGRVRQQAEPDVLHRRPADLAVARLVGGFTELPGTVRGGTHHSAWGALPVDPAAGLSDGAATLLLRREALTLGEVTRGSRGPGATGVVEALRHRGVRRLARVACGDGASSVLAEVELPAGHPVALGDRVRVTAPAEPAWAVADGQP